MIDLRVSMVVIKPKRDLLKRKSLKRDLPNKLLKDNTPILFVKDSYSNYIALHARGSGSTPDFEMFSHCGVKDSIRYIESCNTIPD
jgi:hypothetical protein